MERRQEVRKPIDLVVTISGRDAAGLPFCQHALASSISLGGALVSGITRELRPGDHIWLEYAGKKGRFKVVWLRDSDSPRLIQAAVHRCGIEDCPWGDAV
jgi:hypothetical protein